MGTFAWNFQNSKSIIPENKRDEFAKRIEVVYQAGGMMGIDVIQLLGKEVNLIHKVKMTEDGINCCYNYFEDDFWENAGFNNEHYYVWSNKIGWRQFNRAVVAAYVLEELYTEGISATMVDGEIVNSWGYVGWINFLFDERFHIKNFDPWKLFETLHDSEKNISYMKERHWLDFGHSRCGFLGSCEVYAVLKGTKKAIEMYDSKEKGTIENLAITAMKSTIDALARYNKESKLNQEVQLQNLMTAIRKYYEMDDENIDKLSTDDDNFRQVCLGLKCSDAPAFIVKAISEVYEKDFWDLWESIRHIARRKLNRIYGNEGYFVKPVSTVEFFGQSPDDMIPYWEENCDFDFSEELREWFRILKNEFDNILYTEFSIKNPLEYILALMEEADENYYRIYTFSEFFEESLENFKDKRYLSLWKLYEKMLRDPELKKAGDVIFVPEGPEYEKVGLHYWGNPPKRRLIHNWNMIDWDKRNNKARVTFRRYMALVANKKLRYKVFGF